ncbi:1,4-dihydroxy-2-naphthoate octaprenyltransferase [Robiginitalea sp. IMCC44478]|uniref:1,4-dihydroxy-2-naphthoate octaprenyltransferase n=1 Tax=Robiginitalea sp. IMCC44478 TaxID=3459122 RepID=UPI00404231A9
MHTLRTWLRAARLRTLPLSVAGVLAGTGIANGYGYSDILLFVLTLLTTLAYQVISNFANDYGDGVKGTDNDLRIGPKRVLQSGALSRSQLKRGIVIMAGISGVLTLLTLLRAFEGELFSYFLLFAGLGALAIWAAVNYTVGDNAYGYRGLGDLFVFLFFGLLSVLGTLFLYTKTFNWEAVLPAIAVGTLSTAVLNLNNLRDIENDRNSGKRTLVVQWGFQKGLVYHFALCLLAFSAMVIFIFLQDKPLIYSLCLLPFLIIGRHLIQIYRIQNPNKLDPELKKVALSTFAMALIIYLVNNYFL